MNRRQRYSLLIVRGDGVRLLRINFRRRAVLWSGLFVITMVLALVLTTTGYIRLRQLTGEARYYAAEIARQRATIAQFSERAAELRRQVIGWQQLHARIWEPFGPDVAPKGRGTGIGGAVEPHGDTAPQASSASVELSRLAEGIMQEGENLRALDQLMSRAGKVLAVLPSRWPVRGAVNSEFGARSSPWTRNPEFHSGIDIGVPPGTPVHTPSAGAVVFAGDHGDRGLMVLVDHGHDVRSHYGHLSKVSVRTGQWVERGVVVGFTGNTGRSTGPHLHYEILVKGRSVNPRAFLWD